MSLTRFAKKDRSEVPESSRASVDSHAVKQKSPAIQINTMPLILAVYNSAQIWLSLELPFAVGKAYYQTRREGNLCSICTTSPWPHPELSHLSYISVQDYGHKTIHPAGCTSFGMTPSGYFFIFRQMEASVSHTFPTAPPQSKPSPSNFFLNHRNSNSVWLVYVTNAPRSVFCLNSCEKHCVCFTQRYITLD